MINAAAKTSETMPSRPGKENSSQRRGKQHGVQTRGKLIAGNSGHGLRNCPDSFTMRAASQGLISSTTVASDATIGGASFVSMSVSMSFSVEFAAGAAAQPERDFDGGSQIAMEALRVGAEIWDRDHDGQRRR